MKLRSKKSENNLSDEQQMAFYVKVANYIKAHPEFVEELEERMELEEHPEKAVDIDYLIKRNLKGMGNNAGVIADNITEFFFRNNKKDSWVRSRTQNYVKDIVSGYLSKYLER